MSKIKITMSEDDAIEVGNHLIHYKELAGCKIHDSVDELIEAIKESVEKNRIEITVERVDG